jgi:hypothetical protein
MLTMIDKRNPNRSFQDTTVDKLIDKAKTNERRGLFVYRKRIAYNQYLIQMWDFHPSNEKNKAKMLWEIYGVKRPDIKAMKEFPNPEPARPIVKGGQPVKGDPNPTQLSILKGGGGE